MKKIILGFDVSSSVIGWSVFNVDTKNNSASLVTTGNIKPLDKKKSNGEISVRLNSACIPVKALIEKYSPDEIIVEDYAKRFSKGRSTASVIIILSVFNESVCLLAYNHIKAPVHRYPVVTIRATLGKFFNQKIVSKDDLYPVIVAKCSNFKQKFNKKGNLAKESLDEADAVAVVLTHLIKKYPSTTTWDL
jgi:Holliday junction resolvasome RuvABC endonuclease subunit